MRSEEFRTRSPVVPPLFTPYSSLLTKRSIFILHGPACALHADRWPTGHEELLWRLGLVGLLLLLLTLWLWLDREGLRDHADENVSVLDVLYFTIVTITTVGYGDSVPVSPAARVFDAFVITPVRAVVWFIFFGTAYQLAIKQLQRVSAWRSSKPV